MPDDHVITRRSFLLNIARTSGAAAAYAALDALGASHLAVGAKHVYRGPPQLPAGLGKGKRITILGAGVAGLTCAYELSKAGFQCTVLEARSRPGGRNWTIRGGDTVVQSDGIQQVAWPHAPHLYFNAGPARIPNHHQAVLGYCREFKVPLEIMMNDNRAAYLQDDKVFDGRPIEARQMYGDSRGHFAELLAKAASSGGLDQALSQEDRERLLDALATFGDLRKGRYLGSERSGYIDPPGAALNFGTLREPLPLSELLKADLWEYKAGFAETYEQAGTMLQPVGGMDQIPKAFARHVHQLIRYDTVVDEIRKTEKGARVVCHHKGARSVIDSDYVICTIPMSVLKTIANDFAPSYRQAIAEVRYASSAKIAFYAPHRWWEEEEGIYGGLSWTSREITQILYPSHGIGQRDGALVGSYTFGIFPEDDLGKFPVKERLAMALASGEKIHPGYAGKLRAGVSVAWPNVQYNLGSWAEWKPEQRDTIYRTLLEPDGAIYFAGEHTGNLMSWQEGAILSAHRTIEQLAARVRA